MIYLDYAATTPLDKAVFSKMTPYLTEHFGNASSQHAFGRQAADAVLGARDDVARILGCLSEEIYFVSGGTEAGNWALKGACAQSAGRHIVLSAIEHPALLESAEDLKKFGFEVTLVYPDGSGAVDPLAVRSAIRKDTVFCAVMHANNETGVIQPVEEIGEICKERGVFYYCDCVQTAGVLPLPVKFCDALGISAHKFYGPKGVGALYVRRGTRISRLISGGKQERGLRGGTTNTAGAVGLAEALKIAVAESEKNNRYVAALRDKFVARVLGEIEGASLNGDKNNRLPSNANIAFGGCDGANIVFLLDMGGVAVSAGSACSAGATTPSHVLTAMGLDERVAKSSVRFTFGKYNTEEEVDTVIAVLARAIENIRKVAS